MEVRLGMKFGAWMFACFHAISSYEQVNTYNHSYNPTNEVVDFYKNGK